MDFEKLGLFYLGRPVDAATGARHDAPLLYDASDLVTHGVIVGMTGSGKTGLGIGLMEEAAIDGVPVLAIDPKGDLANLLLTFPGLSGAEFAPWVNPDEARTAQQTVEAFGAAEAARWKQGLAEWSQDGARIQRLKDAAEFAIYTPGSAAAVPISIAASFAAPPRSVLDDPDLLTDRVATAATSVLALAGVDAEPMRSREHVLVSTLFTEAWKAGRNLDLAALINDVQSPPVSRVGVLELEGFFPSKDRFALAMQLNQLLAAPGFAAWLRGDPLDIGRLLYNAQGKPRVSVISIAHLDDPERMFFVSLLLNELVAWVRAQRGTSSLRALVYFDEIYGFLPPVANPPSKPPLLTLLKQARAFGVGLTLATQNPVDLDYKALANCGTWMLGRLQTDRDKARVLDGLEGATASSGEGFDRTALDRMLSALGKRRFLLHNVHDQEPSLFETRWTLSYLRGPMGRDEIRRLAAVASPSAAAPAEQPAAALVPGAAASAAPPMTGPAAARPVTPASKAPVLDPAIRAFFAPGDGSTWVPMLAGAARVRYTDAKLDLDDSRDILVVTPIADAAVPVDWEHAEPAAFTTADLTAAPADTSRGFVQLPAPATKAKSYAGWEKEFAKWAQQSQGVGLLRCTRGTGISHPGESERDFRIRLQNEFREARDAALAKVRAKYAARLQAAADKLLRAEQTIQKESQQATESKVSAAVSMGATVLGALFGRKAVSMGTIGRATTTARGVSRMGRESADVTRAQANAEAVRQQHADLEAALADELQTVQAEWDGSALAVEPVTVKPKRGGVSVQLVALVWVPQ